ncbi:MAG TPA: ABC transporter permease [Planctomycetaceae bacterium]|nr:ABC transporter permease [Planctomycetaceae bacterium]
MSIVQQERWNPVVWLGELVIAPVSVIGDFALFALLTLRWTFSRWPKGNVLWANLYQIGVLSLPVVMVTGGFIGMVLAVQSYDQLRVMHMESRLGSVVNMTLVKELGPVLAATMLAGRVGSAIAAELGTMRVTEQIDALEALGADPIQYLVVPRFLGCVLLIPMLTIIADTVGMLCGWVFSTTVLGINSYYYWYHTYAYISLLDVYSGILKSISFGAAIALVSCHRGFHAKAGAQGVGTAATQTFVFSFVLILFLDFLAGVVLSQVYIWLDPA